MFRGLISDVKSAAGSLIAKYLARASVVAPFVIALAFATAAITLMLIDRFGSIAAFWMLAGGFILIGLVATRVATGALIGKAAATALKLAIAFTIALILTFALIRG